MLKRLLLLGMFILLMSSIAVAGPGDTVQVSSSYTADQLVRTGKTNVYSLWVTTDGTNDVTVVVYDNTAASGTTIVQETTIDASALDHDTAVISFYPPVRALTGVYVDITLSAGSCSYKLYYNTDAL